VGADSSSGCGAGADSSSEGDCDCGTEAVTPRPSFLSFLPEGHGMHLFSFNYAGRYLNVMGAPLLAQTVRHEPDLGAARDLCACLEWIAWPKGVSYAALPDKARETLHMLLGLEPSPSFNPYALARLMNMSPSPNEANHGPRPLSYTQILPVHSNASMVTLEGRGLGHKRPSEPNGSCEGCIIRKRASKISCEHGHEGLTDEMLLEQLAE
jgi:hypothetical protein